VKIILAPDSFKGSLDALSVAKAMEEGVRRVWVEAQVRLFPMADGGEGTLDAVLAGAEHSGKQGVERAILAVPGADGRPVDAAYGILHEPDGRVAVIEIAKVVGLPLVDAKASPVSRRSTRGVGLLLRHCLEQGIRHFMIGLGGSSTNDGGAGVLAALGAKFLDASGAEIEPMPEALARLDRIDISGLDARAQRADIILLSDVSNPLCGEQGATMVFGPQKGVAPDQVQAVDAVLARYAQLADAAFGRTVASEPGAGAAGGLGYAFQLLGGQHRAGAEVVGDVLGLAEAMPGAYWVLTGEGRSDAQTAHGKVPFVVARYARRFRVPTTLVSGSVDTASMAEWGSAFAGCFSIVSQPMSLDEAVRDARTLIADTVEQLARLREITTSNIDYLKEAR
jgi:glycerate kinase